MPTEDDHTAICPSGYTVAECVPLVLPGRPPISVFPSREGLGQRPAGALEYVIAVDVAIEPLDLGVGPCRPGHAEVWAVVAQAEDQASHRNHWGGTSRVQSTFSTNTGNGSPSVLSPSRRMSFWFYTADQTSHPVQVGRCCRGADQQRCVGKVRTSKRPSRRWESHQPRTASAKTQYAWSPKPVLTTTVGGSGNRSMSAHASSKVAGKGRSCAAWTFRVRVIHVHIKDQGRQ